MILHEANRPTLIHEGSAPFYVQNLGPGLVDLSPAFAQGSIDAPGLRLLVHGFLVVTGEADDPAAQLSAIASLAETIVIVGEWTG